MQWFLTFFAHWTSKSKKELPRTKLGRIHSNLFEFRFFEFAILNSNSEFESQKLWLRPNSTVEFEESNLNSKNFTIYRPKMHKIHPFWSKKKSFLTILVLNLTKFESLGLLNSSLIGWIRIFGLNLIKLEVEFELKFQIFLNCLSRIRNSSKLS